MSKHYAGLYVIKDGSFSFEDAMLYYSDIPLSYFIIKTITERKKETKMARITNQVTVDLRNYTPAALKKIKSITNTPLILLPENPTPEFSEAYAEIKKVNVVDEISIPGNACMFNGSINLTQKDLTQGSVIICNGNAVLRDIPKEMNIKVRINGNLIKSPSAFVEIIKINGSTYEIAENAKLILSNAELNIDTAFLRSSGEETAIIACGKVFIDDEISDDMLHEKGLKFYGVGQIVAKKELHGYIHANSYGVGLVQTKEEAEKRNRKYTKKKSWWK